MTVQQISDEFTLLSHQGKAQAVVMHVSGEEVKNITGIELIGDDTALIISEKTDPKLKDKLLDLKANYDFVLEGKDVEIKELRDNYEQYKAVAEPTIKELEQKLEQTEKDLADYQFNYPTIKELEKENAELKAQIKLLGERCNQLLKDKGELTDKVRELVEPTVWCEIPTFDKE